MKAWESPGSPAWIIHGRFLLAKINDEVLRGLFWKGHEQVKESNLRHNLMQFQHWNLAAAAYLTGILNKKQFLPDVLRLVPLSTSEWYGTAPFIALALMQEGETVAQIEACRQDETCREGAEIALELIRKGSLITHLGRKGEKQIRNGIAFAHRLRAGIPFQDERVWKPKMSRLLTDSTIPLHAMEGCLVYEPPRTFGDGKGSMWGYLPEHEKTMLTSLVHKPKPESLGGLPIPRHEKTTLDWTFTKAVLHFLRDGGGPWNLARTLATAAQNTFPQDLLGGLEADWHYRLPPEVVTMAYERLLKLLPPSDYLFEAYAYALLMRGNENDAKARQLLERAQHLQKTFRWVLFRRQLRFAVTPDYQLQEEEVFMAEKGTQLIFNHR